MPSASKLAEAKHFLCTRHGPLLVLSTLLLDVSRSTYHSCPEERCAASCSKVLDR